MLGIQARMLSICEFSWIIEVVTDVLRCYRLRLCKPTDFHHHPCPMLDQVCV